MTVVVSPADAMAAVNDSAVVVSVGESDMMYVFGVLYVADVEASFGLLGVVDLMDPGVGIEVVDVSNILGVFNVVIIER